MENVGSRLRILREGLGISQSKLAENVGLTQSTINRYEAGQSEASYKVLLWYADHFDVSMDYIFGRTENPQGKLYSYTPDTLKEQMSRQEDWKEFVEACFDPRSPMNAKLKEMMLTMMGGGDQ